MNTVRFRKMIEDRKNLLIKNPMVRDRYEAMIQKFLLRQKEERKQKRQLRFKHKKTLIET